MRLFLLTLTFLLLSCALPSSPITCVDRATMQTLNQIRNNHPAEIAVGSTPILGIDHAQAKLISGSYLIQDNYSVYPGGKDFLYFTPYRTVTIETWLCEQYRLCGCKNYNATP